MEVWGKRGHFPQSGSLGLTLEFGRTQITERRMPAPRVVPTLQEFKDRQPGFSLRLELPAVQKLALQRREKALAHRIVETVADRSHRRPHPHLPAPLTEPDRPVLRPLVRM